MKFRKTTAKTVAHDLRAYAMWLDRVTTSPREKTEAATWFNTKMDELLLDDNFGTEVQFDPRGDHRG